MAEKSVSLSADNENENEKEYPFSAEKRKIKRKNIFSWTAVRYKMSVEVTFVIILDITM